MKGGKDWRKTGREKTRDGVADARKGRGGRERGDEDGY